MKFLSLAATGESVPGYQQITKERNIHRVFDLVRSGSCASRVEITRTMRVSATTVSSLVEKLIELNLIKEDGFTQTAQAGRRPMSLQLNRDGRQIVVFSLSRKGVRFSLFDLGCQILESLFVAYGASDARDNDSGDYYAGLFEEILRHRSKRLKLEKVPVIGISLPGIYIEEERMFSSTAMDIAFSEASMCRLGQRLGIPIFIANMSMSLAYAEKKAVETREGAEIGDLMFVNACDGVSAGIIYQGAIYTGSYNTAGEFGHISIDPQGPRCRCGGRGCLEQYVNLNAILKNAKSICEEAGIRPPETFADFAGDYARLPAMKEMLNDTAKRLAYGIYALMCTTGIYRVVIGGGIEVLGGDFLQSVEDELHTKPMLTSRLKLTYASTGSDGDATGVAQYYLDKYYTIYLSVSRS